MSEKKPQPSLVLPLPLLVVAVLAMVGSTGLALLLIPQLSMEAAIRGGTTAIAVFLFTQIGARLMYRQRRRGGRA